MPLTVWPVLSHEPQLYAVVLVLYSLRAGSGLFSAAGAATRRPHATTA